MKMRPSDPSPRHTPGSTGHDATPTQDFTSATGPSTDESLPRLGRLIDVDAFSEDDADEGFVRDSATLEEQLAAIRAELAENRRLEAEAPVDYSDPRFSADGPMPDRPVGDVRIDVKGEAPAVREQFAKAPITGWETMDLCADHFQPGHPDIAGNRVSRFELEDGSGWMHRPQRREGSPEMERAYYETSEHLGLGVVPETHLVDVDGSPGSVQKRLPLAPETPEELAPGEVRWSCQHLSEDEDGDDFYDTIDFQAQWDSVVGTAVQHHVTALGDAHPFQVVVADVDGQRQLRTFDGEWTHHFSEKPKNGGPGIEGVMKGLEDGRPAVIPEKILAGLEATDLEAWRASLREHGVPEDEIDGSVERLERVKTNGMEELLQSDPYWSQKPRVDALRAEHFPDAPKLPDPPPRPDPFSRYFDFDDK